MVIEEINITLTKANKYFLAYFLIFTRINIAFFFSLAYTLLIFEQPLQ
jgi:hypothetical protein